MTISNEGQHTTSAPLTARQEWRRYWPMVMAACIGIGFPIMPFNSLGLFLDPVGREFDWGRSMVTAGGSLAAIIAIPVSPFIGALVDRVGARRLALPGLVLTGGAMASFSLANGTEAQWIMLWGFYAVVSLLLKSTIWTAAITHAFGTGRSMALAVVLAGGQGLSTAITAPLAAWLIEGYGWRAAYWMMAAGWGAPALLLAFLFLRDVGKGAVASGSVGTRSTAHLPGLSVREAIRSAPLLRIGFATFFTLIMTSALMIHKVPLLVEAGIARQTAAFLTSMSGIAGIAGGLSSGWLLGRFKAGAIGGITNMALALALLPLLEPFRTPTLIVLSMLVVGFAGGTQLQMCTYLTGRYAGLRNYGKIYGVMASIIAFTGAMSPMFGSAIYDLTGSYSLLIMIGIPLTIGSSFLLFGLAPMPDWDARAKAQAEPLKDA